MNEQPAGGRPDAVNEDPDFEPGAEPEPDESEPVGTPRPTLLRRAVGLVVGLVVAYVVGFFLTLFFWTGYPNPYGIALISAALFLLFWVVITIRLATRP